ncbi:hypothetical protein [Streptomyces bohaiensis]|uniref:hypothetical protein n=1 Tax=Streptomyces bohaiensis TaxID=1431344 RepID=UPI003B76837B
MSDISQSIPLLQEENRLLRERLATLEAARATEIPLSARAASAAITASQVVREVTAMRGRDTVSVSVVAQMVDALATAVADLVDDLARPMGGAA